jgi:hypothetical protein
MQNDPVGAELFHANGRTDRQTDTTKLTVAVRNFANAPKNTRLTSDTYIHWKKKKIYYWSRIKRKSSWIEHVPPAAGLVLLWTHFGITGEVKDGYTAHVRAISVWPVPYTVVCSAKAKRRSGVKWTLSDSNNESNYTQGPSCVVCIHALLYSGQPPLPPLREIYL